MPASVQLALNHSYAPGKPPAGRTLPSMSRGRFSQLHSYTALLSRGGLGYLSLLSVHLFSQTWMYTRFLFSLHTVKPIEIWDSL